MIESKQGNLLEENAEALVNTVNCVGIMGKGIALQLKKVYPENFYEYEKAWKAKQVQPGQMFIFQTNSLFHPKYIINFPTKQHWKNPSKIEDIKSGLVSLVTEVQRLNITSIAIPQERMWKRWVRLEFSKTSYRVSICPTTRCKGNYISTIRRLYENIII